MWLAVLAGLIIAILVGSYYVFPNYVCPTVGQTSSPGTIDPFVGFCSVFK